MSSRAVDEETPLLEPADTTPSTRRPTPLRRFQFSMLLLLHGTEQLAVQVIYPFAPQLIRDLGVTKGNEHRVGYYVGILQSLSYLIQAVTVLHWSRTSDRVGRKPVLLLGIFGLCVSMYSFGLSRTFWGLALSRCFYGLLNGNLGVYKSMLGEMTDTTNRAKAYAGMPIAWAVGGALGPMIGGSLSRPAERFPAHFGTNEFLIKHPYFLPCAVPATFAAIAWFATLFLLKETVQSPAPLRYLFTPWKAGPNAPTTNTTTRPRDVARSHSHSHSRSRSYSHSRGMSPDHEGTQLSSGEQEEKHHLPLRSLLTPRVVIATVSYASLALIDISFRAIQPLFLSTPIEHGGLGLPPSSIGKILSTYGFMNGMFQLLFFARIHDRWGSKKLFVGGVMSAFPAFAAFPLINHLARVGAGGVVWWVVAFQTTISIGLSMSYGAVFMFITAAAPNRASFGATNGLSQTTVNVMRAIGPASANSLFSLSMEKHYLGGNLVYFVLVGMVAITMMVASFLPRKVSVAY